jgi:hypothetical protein
MAQLIPCPPSYIEKAKRQTKIHGQTHYVVFDDLMLEYEVYSKGRWRQRQRCDGFEKDRYTIVAAALNKTDEEMGE